LRATLNEAKESGITSICALRGDPPVGVENWVPAEGGLSSALQLVSFIRQEHGDYFSIAVSGYPEGHPTVIHPVADETKLSASERSRLIRRVDKATGAVSLMVCSDADYAREIAYVKKKVDAGGQLVITQMFFDPVVFLTFLDDCRAAGIRVPILPGILLPINCDGFVRMTNFCKTRIPEAMEAKLSECCHDEARFASFRTEYLTDMCRTVWATNKVPNLHFYCLNNHTGIFPILANLGVEIDALDKPSDQEEVARVHELVKTFSAQAAQPAKTQREEAPAEANGAGAAKRAKTSEASASTTSETNASTTTNPSVTN